MSILLFRRFASEASESSNEVEACSGLPSLKLLCEAVSGSTSEASVKSAAMQEAAAIETFSVPLVRSLSWPLDNEKVTRADEGHEGPEGRDGRTSEDFEKEVAEILWTTHSRQPPTEPPKEPPKELPKEPKEGAGCFLFPRVNGGQPTQALRCSSMA